MNNIPEKDWKIVRSMKDRVLDLACDRILAKISEIIDNDGENAHTRYLELWSILREENENIALMFDDIKRSNAIFKLANWKSQGLISDNDMKSLSREIQDKVKKLKE